MMMYVERERGEERGAFTVKDLAQGGRDTSARGWRRFSLTKRQFELGRSDKSERRRRREKRGKNDQAFFNSTQLPPFCLQHLAVKRRKKEEERSKKPLFFSARPKIHLLLFALIFFRLFVFRGANHSEQEKEWKEGVFFSSPLPFFLASGVAREKERERSRLTTCQ